MIVATNRVVRACTAFSALLLAAASGTPAAAIEYNVAAGYAISGVALEMKPDGETVLCFVTVSVKNASGKDQVMEIALDTDEGYSVITYSGGPARKPTKAGAIEKAEFKTILTRLPKDIAITVKAAE